MNKIKIIDKSNSVTKLFHPYRNIATWVFGIGTLIVWSIIGIDDFILYLSILILFGLILVKRIIGIEKNPVQFHYVH